MRNNIHTALLVALSMQLLAACTSGDRMRRDLAELEARNQSDSLLTDSTLALSLADYFTTHGTQAERLEAHYLLARTWADLGQAPRALDAFHTAAEQADTTRLDSASCHFLSRIYGQMGGLLDDEVIPWDAIAALNKASCYALLEKDTLSAIIFDEQKVRPYHDLQYYDSVLTVCERAMRSYQHYGETSRYVYAMSSKIYAFLQTRRYDSISPIINRYVSLAHAEDMTDGYFHSLLARYYQGINSYDSAIHHYHIQLALTSVLAGKAVPYRGLSQCYRAMGLSDSANKYNELYCMANDSSVLFKYQSTMQQMQHLYDYSHFEKLAHWEFLKSRRLYYALFVVFAVFSTLLIILKRKKAHKEVLLQKVSIENSVLNVKLEDQRKAIDDYQAEIQQFQETEDRRNLLIQSDKNDASPLLKSLHQKAGRAQKATHEEMGMVREMFAKAYPKQYSLLKENEAILTDDEWDECALLMFRFVPSEIMILLDISNQMVTNNRARLVKKLFNKKGGAKDFDRLFKNLSYT